MLVRIIIIRNYAPKSLCRPIQQIMEGLGHSQDKAEFLHCSCATCLSLREKVALLLSGSVYKQCCNNTKSTKVQTLGATCRQRLITGALR